MGIAIQAYLFRTAKDIESLIPLGAAIRIVKGAYWSRPTWPFRGRKTSDENFFKLCTRLMSQEAQEAGVLLHIATHDIRARRSAERLDHRAQGADDGLRVRDAVRDPATAAAAAGPRRQALRVLICYGEYWFPWYMRRLAERPANVWFVVRNLG